MPGRKETSRVGESCKNRCEDAPLEMMGVVNHSANKNQSDNDWNSWKMMSIAIDSGAAETVIPHAMTSQTAPVAKPLGSVDRICETGHLVVFDCDGSYILNKTTGEPNWLRKEN